MKTIEKRYFVCEICGKASQNEDKIRECQESHLIISDDCEIETIYPKGKVFPEEIKVKFPDGALAGYVLNYSQKGNKG